jgi:uncharacterized membrane protein
MLRIALTYVVTLVVFGAFDAVWLGVISGSMYRATLGDILLEKFRAGPAIAFYLLNLVGIMIFVIPGAPTADSWKTTLLYGALFGIFTYATYDLTNYATLKAFTLQLTLADIAWGCFITAVASTLGMLGAEAILRLIGSK